MQKNSNKIFLVSPLEWGLGHATRLSVIIRRLLAENHDVIIAADGLPYNFLAAQFPQLTIERLPLRQIRYASSRKGFFLKLFFQLPAFFLSIHKSARQIDGLVRKYHIDYIISDNRYGFIHTSVPSIFISHQLSPMPPPGWRRFQSLIGRLHLFFLRNYREIWVPDFPSAPRVSGKLASIGWKNSRIRYIGPQSWLAEQPQTPPESEESYDILVMLSGPEPHRSRLEEKILVLLAGMPDKKTLVLQGLPQQPGMDPIIRQTGSVKMINHLPGPQIKKLIQNTPIILCRAGVVTIYDLAVLQRPALLIPTEGQTEQEYVAATLDRLGYFKSIQEKDLCAEHLQNFHPADFRLFNPPETDLLGIALTSILQPAQNQADAWRGQHGQSQP